jgi:hypothetical protein
MDKNITQERKDFINECIKTKQYDRLVNSAVFDVDFFDFIVQNKEELNLPLEFYSYFVIKSFSIGIDNLLNNETSDFFTYFTNNINQIANDDFIKEYILTAAINTDQPTVFMNIVTAGNISIAKPTPGVNSEPKKGEESQRATTPEETLDFKNIKEWNIDAYFLYACEIGAVNIVSYLVENNLVNINAQNENGENAAYLSYKSGHPEMVTFLNKQGLYDLAETEEYFIAKNENRFNINLALERLPEAIAEIREKYSNNQQYNQHKPSGVI